MAILSGTAHAAEAALGSKVGIKWPNDIVVNSRKLAGILVEQSDHRAVVGVGINVRQSSWPAELACRAVSLRQLDCGVDRIDVLTNLIAAIDRALCATIDVLAQEYSLRNALRNAGFTAEEQRANLRGIDPSSGSTSRSAYPMRR